MSTSNNNEIKAILWDFGGVFTSSPFEAFNVLEEQLGIPTDFIRGVNAINPTDNAWAKFESNDVSLDEFDQLFAAESEQMGHRVSGKKVVAVLSGNLRPRMVSTLQHCKEYFQVACITNNVKAGHGPSMTRDPAKADAVAEVMKLFDQVIESSKEGIRKPNPQIYLTACERLSVQPHNAVFLDDLGINLKPARELGMQTIKVLSEAQAIDDLAKLTGLTFD